MTFEAATQGFLLSASLIVAIGAQNAFVLRQGLMREHVVAVVAFCAASDALLIALGVMGVGAAAAAWPGLDRWLALGGAVFLAAYGVRALLRAAAGVQVLAGGAQARRGVASVLAQAAAFTFLNPHVYLDTLWLVGSVGAQQPVAQRPAFVIGGAVASASWFIALGCGARWLAPWFARPSAWRWLDGIVAATMLGLSLALARHALRA